MKKFICIMLFGLLSGYSTVTFGLIDQMKLELIDQSNLSKERDLFLKYWSSKYQNHTLTHLGFSSLVQFLNDAFDIEEQDYQKHVKNQFFCRAVIENQLVGYVSFDIGADKSAYIRQWAFLPEVNNVDGISELLFVVFDHVPDVSCIYLTTRYVLEDFIKSITEIGFEKVEVQVEGYDPKYYASYMIACYDKCGTCYCECDDEDLSYEMMSDSGVQDAAVEMGLMAPLGCGCSGGSEEEEAE